MSMRYSPNYGAGSRIVVIKLLMIYRPISWVLFYSQNCSSGTGGVCWKIWNLSVIISWRVIAGCGLTC